MMMTKKFLTESHVLVLSFLFLIIVGTLLLKLPAASYTGTSWIDALFTSTSAVCVTGLIVVDTATHFTVFGQTVILFLIQLGGIGLMTFAATFIIAFSKRLPLSNRIMMEDSFIQGISQVKLPRMLIFIVKYTFILQGVGIVFFMLFFREPEWGKRLYFSVFHAISAFCNAGFSTYTDSLMGYHDHLGVNLTTMTLIIGGGIGFIVAYELRSKFIGKFFNKRKSSRLKPYHTFSLHTWIVLVTSGILILGGALLIYSIEAYSGGNLSLLESFFQSVTARTAGFNTVDIGKLHSGTLTLISVLMFIGGSPGSAAGGLKTTTFAVIFSMMFMGRNNFEDVVIRNRQLPRRTVFRALIVFIFATAIVFGAVICISVFDSGKPSLAVFFESVSAFGTVGLSTGITGGLNDVSKLILTATMFAGRIGSLSLFSIFLLRKKNPFVYASENILVG